MESESGYETAIDDIARKQLKGLPWCVVTLPGDQDQSGCHLGCHSGRSFDWSWRASIPYHCFLRGEFCAR